MKVIRQIRDEVGIISFEGHVTKKALFEHTEYLNPLLGDRSLKGVILNFGEVQLIDSSGIGWIIKIFNSCLRRNQFLSICHVNPPVLKLFGVTGVDEIFNIFPTEKEALKAVAA